MSWILLKIPVTLATAFYATSAFSPPQPIPHVHERNRYQGLNFFEHLIESRSMTIVVPVMKRTSVVVGCIDALFCLAHVYRATLPKISIFSSVNPVLGTAHPKVPLTYVITTLVVILSSYVRKRCYRELGKHFTYELSIRDNHKLVTTGPYAIVRHPSYTAGGLLVASLTFWGTSPGSWLIETGILQTVAGKVFAALWAAVLVTVASWIARAPKEDAALRSEFGKKWEAYAQMVPYMYIPWVV